MQQEWSFIRGSIIFLLQYCNRKPPIIDHVVIQEEWSLTRGSIFLIIIGRSCPALTAPSNGKVWPDFCQTKGNYFEYKCHYRCNNNFNAVGDVTRTCQADGSWNRPTKPFSCQAGKLYPDFQTAHVSYAPLSLYMHVDPESSRGWKYNNWIC